MKMTMGHTTILNDSGRQIVVSNSVTMNQIVVKLTA
jgi:hypothetical protein